MELFAANTKIPTKSLKAVIENFPGTPLSTLVRKVNLKKEDVALMSKLVLVSCLYLKNMRILKSLLTLIQEET